MAFLTLGGITGMNTSTVTVGLPSLLLGPLEPAAAATLAARKIQQDVIFGASGTSGYVGNQAGTSGSTSITATPAESRDFYTGLLAEVNPEYLEFFIRQGISRELLFYLFTDRILIQRNGGTAVELLNDPLNKDFGSGDKVDFQNYVKLAMNYGLSSEPVPSKPSDHSKNKSDTQSKEQAALKYQICFNKTYMTPGIRSDTIAPICGSGKVSADGRMVTYLDPQGEAVNLTVLPRSTFAIFQFLGRIVAAGDQGRIKLTSEEAIGQLPLRDEYLFDIETEPSGACFLTVDYEGLGYCVPMVGAANTKRILSLLTQLIALNTSLSSIPVTPTVQVLQ
jgi:hypothetical protein